MEVARLALRRLFHSTFVCDITIQPPSLAFHTRCCSLILIDKRATTFAPFSKDLPRALPVLGAAPFIYVSLLFSAIELHRAAEGGVWESNPPKLLCTKVVTALDSYRCNRVISQIDVDRNNVMSFCSPLRAVPRPRFVQLSFEHRTSAQYVCFSFPRVATGARFKAFSECFLFGLRALSSLR